MKIIIFLFALSILASCNEINTSTVKKVAGTQQEVLTAILEKHDSKILMAPNELKKKAYLDTFDYDLERYLDTVPVFYNWKGVVKDMRLREESGYSIVDYYIEYSPEQYKELRFICTYIIKTKDANKDSMYNELKEFTYAQNVFVDGFIERDAAGKIKYDTYDILNENRTAYPRYKFKVIDIRIKDTTSYPSTNLITANKLNSQIFSLLSRYSNKSLSQSEWKKETKYLNDSLSKIQQKLSPFERAIVEKTKVQMVSNFYNN